MWCWFSFPTGGNWLIPFPVLLAQSPCPGLTCFIMIAGGKALQRCICGPTTASAGQTEHPHLHVCTAQPPASPATSAAAHQQHPSPCFHADYRTGVCQEMSHFKCLPPTPKLAEKQKTEGGRCFREHHTGQELFFAQFPEVILPITYS